MDNESMARKTWENLLSTGGYSIGYFSVTVEDDKVRVFHSRTKEVTYLDRENAYEGMERLCERRGYNLEHLLKYYHPKSFRSVNRTERYI